MECGGLERCRKNNFYIWNKRLFLSVPYVTNSSVLMFTIFLFAPIIWKDVNINTERQSDTIDCKLKCLQIIISIETCIYPRIPMNYFHQIPQGARRAVMPRTATSLNTVYMETISVEKNYTCPKGQI